MKGRITAECLNIPDATRRWDAEAIINIDKKINISFLFLSNDKLKFKIRNKKWNSVINLIIIKTICVSDSGILNEWILQIKQ